MTVSAEEGKELYDLQDEAFTALDVVSHLKELREINEKLPLAVFMDNAKIHDNELVEECCKKLDIRRVFNVGYSPELNPIELCFSQAKRYYSHIRLNKLANNVQFDRHRLIQKALAKITPDLVKACARKSDYLLRNS